MFCIVDAYKSFTPIKSGFKTASQANNWAKKNLPKDELRLWGKNAEPWDGSKHYRYFVRMK